MNEDELLKITEDLYAQVELSGENFVSSMDKTLPLGFECDKLIICGMGGSGISGNYIKKLAEISSLKRVELNKTYHLPRYIDSTWNAIVVSYSGNTEETLSMLGQLLNLGILPVMISSNGKIAEIAAEKNVEYVEVPSGIAPRAAFPYLFGSLYGLVASTLGLVIPSQETRENWRKTSKFDTEPYEEIARSLLGHFPLILQANILSNVGLRFRCQVNENAKLSAANYNSPEFSHNGIVGFDGKDKGRALLLLRSAYEDPRTQIHLDFLEEQKGIVNYQNSFSVESRDEVEEHLRLTWITDYLSIKLAEIQGIDPLAVPSIERLKTVLSGN